MGNKPSFVCCHECLSLFADKKHLRRHQRECGHTRPSGQKPKAKPKPKQKRVIERAPLFDASSLVMVCAHPKCGKRFRNRERFRKHTYAHTKRYRCTFDDV